MANDPTLLPKAIDAVPSNLTNVVRDPVTDIYESSARLTIGGSGRLRGATLTVDVLPTATGTEIVGRPQGLWTWIERGIRQHRISSDRPMPIQLEAAPFASGSVMHPGVSKWSGAWTRAGEVTDGYLASDAWPAVWRNAKAGNTDG